MTNVSHILSPTYVKQNPDIPINSQILQYVALKL